MKANLVRNLVATTSLLAGLTGTSSALAATVFETLGAGAQATDRYTVTCPASPVFLLNTNRLTGTVTDLFPIAAPLVSMQFTKGLVATNTTDPIDGPFFFPAPSPVATLVAGSGAYTVLVDKTAAGAENYRIDVFCRNIFGAPLATPVVITQDQ